MLCLDTCQVDSKEARLLFAFFVVASALACHVRLSEIVTSFFLMILHSVMSDHDGRTVPSGCVRKLQKKQHLNTSMTKPPQLKLFISNTSRTGICSCPNPSCSAR